MYEVLKNIVAYTMQYRAMINHIHAWWTLSNLVVLWLCSF